MKRHIAEGLGIKLDELFSLSLRLSQFVLHSLILEKHGCICQSAGAAITKYHKLGDLTKRKFFSHSSGGWKSGSRAPAWPGASESALPGLQTATFSLCAQMVERETRSSLVYLFFFFGGGGGTPCGILVPLPGIKPEPPAVKCGFLTTGPPGKSCVSSFKGTNSFFRVPSS